MPILIVQKDRAAVHASLDNMHRNAGQFQTWLTRTVGPPAQEEDLSLPGVMQTRYQTSPCGPVRSARLITSVPFCLFSLLRAFCVFDATCRPRGVGQALADGSCLTLARNLAHIARRSARADDAGAVKTWGYLRT